MTLSEVLATTGSWVAGLMFALWILSVAKRDVSVVDIFWGPGFALIAWVAHVAAGAQTARGWLLAALTSVWGLRLGLYLLRRNWGTDEDFRYAAMRRGRERLFPLLSLFTVFGLQGALMWIISLPLQLGALPHQPALGAGDALGIGLWAVGFAFEAIGDAQLAAFKADPGNAGRVMDRGLWRYTRHPNYFGDCLIWWGLFLIGGRSHWWSALSPALMTFLLLRVSGVALLERSIQRRRPDYAAYVARTSAFIPWPPRKVDDPR